MSCPRLTFAFHSSYRVSFINEVGLPRININIPVACSRILCSTISDFFNIKIGRDESYRVDSRLQNNGAAIPGKSREKKCHVEGYVCMYMYACGYVYTVHVCACQGENVIKCLVIFHLKNIHFNDQSCEELMTN